MDVTVDADQLRKAISLIHELRAELVMHKNVWAQQADTIQRFLTLTEDQNRTIRELKGLK